MNEGKAHKQAPAGVNATPRGAKSRKVSRPTSRRKETVEHHKIQKEGCKVKEKTAPRREKLINNSKKEPEDMQKCAKKVNPMNPK